MRATTRCLARHFIIAVLVFASTVNLAAAEFGADCYQAYGFTPTTCEEVNSVCFSNECTTSTDGDMNYYCFDSSCSGSFTVPSAFRSACNAMNLTSCDEAESEFNTIGCSCFTCTEADGKVEAECLHPYPCTPPQVPQANDDITDTPELGSTEYGIVSAVYIATAIVLAGSALAVKSYCFPDKIEKKPTIKEIIAANLHEEDWWLLYAFSFEAVVEDDGSQMGFYHYFAAKCDLLGFVDCRKKKTKARSRWTRLWAIFTSFLVTLSLAMLLGTVVFNNSDKCRHTMAVCCECHTYCDGEDIGCDGCACKPQSECSWGYHWCDLNDVSFDQKQSNLLLSCTPPSVAKASTVTVLFTAMMAKAGSMAIDTARNGSLRQKLLHVATLGTSLFLVVFGVLYSYHLSEEDLGDAERFKSITRTLLAGWGYDQLVGVVVISLHFLADVYMYNAKYKLRLEKFEHASAAVVHPHDDQGLDDSIMKTEGIKGGVGNPVTIDEVRLQAPTQQQ